MTESATHHGRSRRSAMRQGIPLVTTGISAVFDHGYEHRARNALCSLILTRVAPLQRRRAPSHQATGDSSPAPSSTLSLWATSPFFQRRGVRTIAPGPGSLRTATEASDATGPLGCLNTHTPPLGGGVLMDSGVPSPNVIPGGCSVVAQPYCSIRTLASFGTSLGYGSINDP